MPKKKYILGYCLLAIRCFTSAIFLSISSLWSSRALRSFCSLRGLSVSAISAPLGRGGSEQNLLKDAGPDSGLIWQSSCLDRVEGARLVPLLDLEPDVDGGCEGFAAVRSDEGDFRICRGEHLHSPGTTTTQDTSRILLAWSSFISSQCSPVDWKRSVYLVYNMLAMVCRQVTVNFCGRPARWKRVSSSPRARAWNMCVCSTRVHLGLGKARVHNISPLLPHCFFCSGPLLHYTLYS